MTLKEFIGITKVCNSVAKVSIINKNVTKALFIHELHCSEDIYKEIELSKMISVIPNNLLELTISEIYVQTLSTNANKTYVDIYLKI